MPQEHRIRGSRVKVKEALKVQKEKAMGMAMEMGMEEMEEVRMEERLR
jgi:hypothetical protein